MICFLRVVLIIRFLLFLSVCGIMRNYSLFNMPNLLRLMSHLLRVMYTELDYITSMSRLRALWQASFNATKRGMFFPKVWYISLMKHLCRCL